MFHIMETGAISKNLDVVVFIYPTRPLKRGQVRPYFILHAVLYRRERMKDSCNTFPQGKSHSNPNAENRKINKKAAQEPGTTFLRVVMLRDHSQQVVDTMSVGVLIEHVLVRAVN